MTKKCFLFDLDGVLVDACHWHYLALNSALKKLCDMEIDYEDHLNRFNGLPTFAKLEMLNIEKEKQTQVWELKQQMTVDTINQNAELDFSKIALHEWLKKEGHIIGCVTNSIKLTANLMLKKTGQFSFMDLIITNQDVQSAKPHPEGYLRAIEAAGFKGKEEDVFIVEDSEKGKKAARATSANLIEVVNAAEVNLDMIKRYL